MVTESPRLRLRPLADADAPFILELLNDPDFLSNVGDRGVRNLQDARRYIEAGPAAGHRRHGFGLCALELKAAAGVICLLGIPAPRHPSGWRSGLSVPSRVL